MKDDKGKRCHKCGSRSIYVEYDMGIWQEHCLLCGYTAPLKEIQIHAEEPVSRRDVV